MTRSGQQSTSIISWVDSSKPHLPELQSLPCFVAHSLVLLLFRATLLKFKHMLVCHVVLSSSGWVVGIRLLAPHGKSEQFIGVPNCLAVSPLRNSKALLSFEGGFVPPLRAACLSCSSQLQGQVLMALGIHPHSVWDCSLLSPPSICLGCLCGLFPLPPFLALFPHPASPAWVILSLLQLSMLLGLGALRVEEQKDEDCTWEVKDLDSPKGVIVSYRAMKGQSRNVQEGAG